MSRIRFHLGNHGLIRAPQRPHPPLEEGGKGGGSNKLTQRLLPLVTTMNTAKDVTSLLSICVEEVCFISRRSRFNKTPVCTCMWRSVTMTEGRRQGGGGRGGLPAVTGSGDRSQGVVPRLSVGCARICLTVSAPIIWKSTKHSMVVVALGVDRSLYL